MVNRVLRDDPSKSNMHNREGLSLRMIWNILKDWRMWPIYAMGIIFMGMPQSPYICTADAHVLLQFLSPLRKPTSRCRYGILATPLRSPICSASPPNS